MKRRADENATPLGCANRGVQLMKHSDLEEAEKRKGRPESTAGLALPRETCFKPLPRRNNFTEKKEQRPSKTTSIVSRQSNQRHSKHRTGARLHFGRFLCGWHCLAEKELRAVSSMLQHAPRPCSLALRVWTGSIAVIDRKSSLARSGQCDPESSLRRHPASQSGCVSRQRCPCLASPSQRSNTTWFVIAHAQKAGYNPTPE